MIKILRILKIIKKKKKTIIIPFATCINLAPLIPWFFLFVSYLVMLWITEDIAEEKYTKNVNKNTLLKRQNEAERDSLDTKI